jgi:hypothetical protein
MANENIDNKRTNIPTSKTNAVGETFHPEATTPERATGDLYDKAKAAASDTYNVVAQKATAVVEDRKSNISEGLSTVAETVRSAGNELRTAGGQNRLTDYSARFSGSIAERLEQAANYFERNDLRSMMSDAEGLARRNPGVFIGGAFIAGILVARFLKSTASDEGTFSGETRRKTNAATGTEPSAQRPAGQFRPL